MAIYNVQLVFVYYIICVCFFIKHKTADSRSISTNLPDILNATVQQGSMRETNENRRRLDNGVIRLRHESGRGNSENIEYGYTGES